MRCAEPIRIEKTEKLFREPDMLREKRIMKKGKIFLENTYRDMKKE